MLKKQLNNKKESKSTVVENIPLKTLSIIYEDGTKTKFKLESKSEIVRKIFY